MQIPLFGRFRWFRRWRGGRWARVTGLVFGRSRFRVGPECVFRTEEDYRNPATMSEADIEREFWYARCSACRFPLAVSGKFAEPGRVFMVTCERCGCECATSHYPLEGLNVARSA